MAAPGPAGPPVPAAQLESVVRLTRDGPRAVRLHELARSMGRPRNHVARELAAIHDDDLGRMLASPRTLLVEGSTDQAVLEHLLRRCGDRLSLVQPAGSKTRLAVLHRLHLALRIPHHVLFDGDGGPVDGSSTVRHRVLRSRREATRSLVATLHAAGDPQTAGASDMRREDPAVAGWDFGGPTVVGAAWSALAVDLEDELSRWPSFLAALRARGGSLAGKRPERVARAAQEAELTDLPAPFRALCAAVTAIEPDLPPTGRRGQGG